AMLVFFRFLHFILLFFFNDPAPSEIYTLSLHDALPISNRSHFGRNIRCRSSSGKKAGSLIFCAPRRLRCARCENPSGDFFAEIRSEEHTSELQSRFDLVCRLLLEKKKKKI